MQQAPKTLILESSHRFGEKDSEYHVMVLECRSWCFVETSPLIAIALLPAHRHLTQQWQRVVVPVQDQRVVVSFNWDVALPHSLQQYAQTYPEALHPTRRLIISDALDGSNEVK